MFLEAILPALLPSILVLTDFTARFRTGEPFCSYKDRSRTGRSRTPRMAYLSLFVLILLSSALKPGTPAPVNPFPPFSDSLNYLGRLSPAKAFGLVTLRRFFPQRSPPARFRCPTRFPYFFAQPFLVPPN